GCGEADFQDVMNAAPCMQHDTPPTCAMGVNQVTDRCNNIRLGQRFQDERTLPQVIFRKRPMLQSAASARTEMFADWIAAFVAGLLDMQKMSAVRVSTNHLDRDNLARQCIWNVDGPLFCFGDPVASMSEPNDVELFSHESPRAETRRCRRGPG